MDTITKSNPFILKWINEIFGTLYFNCPKKSTRSKSYPKPCLIIKFSTLLGLDSTQGPKPISIILVSKQALVYIPTKITLLHLLSRYVLHGSWPTHPF